MKINTPTKTLYFSGICAAMYMGAFLNTVQGVILTDFIDFYKLESYRQGLMSTFQGAGSFLSVCLVIFVSSKIKKRGLLLCGVGVLVASTLLMSMPLPFTVILFMFSGIGVGIAINANVSSALSADLFGGQSATYMCLAHAAFGLGGLTGPLIMNGLLGAGLHWRKVIFVAASIALIVFIFLAYATASSTKYLPQYVQTDKRAITLKDMLMFLKSKQNLLLLIAAFTYSAAQLNTSSWIKRYMTIVMDAEGMGGITLSMYWLGTMLARLYMPKIKLPRLKLLIVSCFGMAVFTAVIPLTNTPLIVMLCILISTLFSGACVPMFYSESCNRNTENTLLATSMIALFLFGGNMAIAPITAACMDISMHGGMLFLAGVALTATLALIINELMNRQNCFQGGHSNEL